MVSDKRDLLQQRVTKKELKLFKGFRGYVKSLFLTAERRDLPIILPDVNITLGKIY
jgi:hypothetical protein